MVVTDVALRNDLFPFEVPLIPLTSLHTTALPILGTISPVQPKSDDVAAGCPKPRPPSCAGGVVFPVTPAEAPAQPPPRRDRGRGGGCCGSCCASGTAFAACCCSHCSYCCRVMPIWRARRSCSCWLRSMLTVLDLRF